MKKLLVVVMVMLVASEAWCGAVIRVLPSVLTKDGYSVTTKDGTPVTGKAVEDRPIKHEAR